MQRANRFKPYLPLDGRIGLYPIVDSVDWVKKLLPLGVRTLQIRIKNKTGAALSNEIKACIALAKGYSTQLFINDYWELAVQHQAYGVHLGQEDLDLADCEKIQEAGLRLGISTHHLAEVERAVAYQPSYIACGSIYPTTSKIMSTPPQGIRGLRYWQDQLDYPLVAIGGINLENISDVLATSVNGIAVISAITQASDPIQMTKKLLSLVEGKYNITSNNK